MITINKLSISADKQNLEVSITAEQGRYFSGVNLWTETTFKDYSLAVDFSSKLNSANENEVFTITATDLQLDRFDGIYLLEFEDNTGELNLGTVAELTGYEECTVDKMLAMVHNNEPCHSPALMNIVNIDMLVESVDAALSLGYIQEAFNFMTILKKLCKASCADCDPLVYLSTPIYTSPVGGEPTDPDTTTDLIPPTQVTGVTASNITVSCVDLSWNAATDNVGVVGYKVYVDGLEAADVVGTSTTLCNLSANTTYVVTITAYDAAGNESPVSDSILVTTLTVGTDVTPPTAPTLVEVSHTAVAATLSWSGATDDVGVVAYDVYRDGVRVGLNVVGLTYLATGLQGSTMYNFTVKAKDSAGNESPNSNTVTVTTDAFDGTPPSAPSTLAVSNLDTTSLTLTWTASTDNVGVIRYEIREGGNFFASTSATSFDVTGLTPNTAYSFQVFAYDAADNESTGSNVVSPTTLNVGDTTPPSVPTGGVAFDIGTTSFSLDWNDSTDDTAVTGYELFLNGVRQAQYTIPTSNVLVTGLEPSTNYTVEVLAFDAAGNKSAKSTPITVSTNAQVDTEPPTDPRNLMTSNVAHDSMDFAWSASTDNVGVAGYNVFLNGIQVATVTQSASYSYTGLSELTTYILGVQAFDEAGNTSNIVTLTESTIEFDDPSVVPAPSNFDVSWQRGDPIIITWTEVNEARVVGYLVEIQIGGQGWTMWREVPASDVGPNNTFIQYDIPRGSMVNNTVCYRVTPIIGISESGSTTTSEAKCVFITQEVV